MNQTDCMSVCLLLNEQVRVRVLGIRQRQFSGQPSTQGQALRLGLPQRLRLVSSRAQGQRLVQARLSRQFSPRPFGRVQRQGRRLARKPISSLVCGRLHRQAQVRRYLSAVVLSCVLVLVLVLGRVQTRRFSQRSGLGQPAGPVQPLLLLRQADYGLGMRSVSVTQTMTLVESLFMFGLPKGRLLAMALARR